jgi:hypothetical protein
MTPLLSINRMRRRQAEADRPTVWAISELGLRASLRKNAQDGAVDIVQNE